MKLSKLDLVYLLREARKEFNKRYSKPDSSKQVTRRNEGEPANTAHSNSQIENENDPLSQARGQARREIGTTVAKSHGLYNLLLQLVTNIEYNKTHGIQDFDDRKTKAIEAGRDLDELISMVREEISLL